MNEATPVEEQIRETAYGFWLEEGQPHGCDEEHWLRAVEALSTQSAKTKPVPKDTEKPRPKSAASRPKAKAAKRLN